MQKFDCLEFIRCVSVSSSVFAIDFQGSTLEEYEDPKTNFKKKKKRKRKNIPPSPS